MCCYRYALAVIILQSKDLVIYKATVCLIIELYEYKLKKTRFYTARLLFSFTKILQSYKKFQLFHQNVIFNHATINFYSILKCPD